MEFIGRGPSDLCHHWCVQGRPGFENYVHRFRRVDMFKFFLRAVLRIPTSTVALSTVPLYPYCLTLNPALIVTVALLQARDGGEGKTPCSVSSGTTIQDQRRLVTFRRVPRVM